MAVNVEELVVKFTADIGGLKTNLERVEKSFKNVDKTVAQTSGKMSAQIAGLGRLFKLDLVLRYGAQLLRLEDQMEQLASTIKDTSDRADIGAEALQRLRHVADQNGTSAEALDSALIRLNKAMGLARLGAEGMGELFQALGLEELIKKGASTEEVFLGIADAVRGMKDESQASAVVAKIMGREADRLIETFKLGGAEAKRLGDTLRGVISQETIDKLDAARDRTEEYRKTINTLGAAASTVFVDIVLFLANIGKELEKNFAVASRIVSLYDSIANFGSGNLAESFGAAPSRGEGNEKAHAAAKHRSRIGQSFAPIPGMANEDRLRTLLGGGSRESAVSGIEREQRAVEDLIADLQFEISIMGQSAEQQAVMEALRRAGSGATAGQREQIEAYTRAIQKNAVQIQEAADLETFAAGIRRQFGDGTEEAAEFQRQLNDALAQGKISIEEFSAAMADALKSDELKELEATWRQIGDTIEHSVADAFVDMATNMNNAREIIAGLIEDIGRLIARQLVLQAIQGITSSIFGGIGGGSGASLGKASGGLVNPGNTYMVGERGPELFVPKVPGNIVPNGGGRGAGGGIVFNQVLNAQGANPATVATLKQMLAQSKDEILRAVPKLMIDKQRRNSLQGAF